MKTVIVTFKDGNTVTTDINGTDEEIKRYFLGQSFQFGDTEEQPGDLLLKAVKVEFLKPTGFMHEGKKIMYIDPHGKDISFNRWRVVLYYHPNFALTHFLDSQQEYDNFISEHKQYCYGDYADYKLSVS